MNKEGPLIYFAESRDPKVKKQRCSRGETVSYVRLDDPARLNLSNDDDGPRVPELTGTFAPVLPFPAITGYSSG